MITVTGSEVKDNKKGPWLVLNYINDKGESKVTNVFNKDVIGQFKGPGKYEATWKQDGKYWNLAGLDFLSPASGNGNGNGNGHPAPAAQANGHAPQAKTVLELKTEIALEALRAATVITKDEGGNAGDKTEKAQTAFTCLANHALDWIKNGGAKKPEEVPQ